MYIELHAASAFSFLDGASLPEALVDRAAALGYGALALLDGDGVYGAPRFHQAAKAAGLKAIIGAELTIRADGGASRARTTGPTRGARFASGAVGEGPVARLSDPPDPTYPPQSRSDPYAVSPSSAPYPPYLWRLPVLVATREGYRNLCRLVTRMKLRAAKGEGALTIEELDGHTAGLVALVGRIALDGARYGVGGLLDRVVGLFGRRHVYVELQRHLLREEETDNQALIALASAFNVPVTATNGVRFATPDARPLYDVLTCIRLKTTLDRAGRRLARNAERYLKPPEEMVRLFADLPHAIAAAGELADRLEYTMADLGYRFPDYPVPPGETMIAFLRQITEVGARERYRPYHDRARHQVERELDLIEKLDLAGYFLIVWDIVNFCRQEGILVQGRGSAANSAVCYSLGITAVDPVGMDLLFERFLSEERGEWPDIDLDLPSGDRRERVIQHVYEKYGQLGAAMTANVITYRGRSAAREVGKALSIEPDRVDRLAKIMNNFEWVDPADTLARHLTSAGFGLDEPRIHLFGALWQAIQDLPRHLGQHSGGMVICKGRLDEVAPLENASMPGRVVIQWDKDDCADMGLVKVDLLGLGMMAVLQDAITLVNGNARGEGDCGGRPGVARGTDGDANGTAARGAARFDLAHLPADDPLVYRMLQEADTIGIFQVESRAQMATLPRLKPKCFYDLVVEVAIIRPGPIVGQMVHPYLNRRTGREAVTYPHPSLQPILERTLGVPLFQEQLLRMAMVAAGFSGGEAEELRRAFGFKRSERRMQQVETKLREGMARQGITGDAAQSIIRSITSFALYGFPESHAASFALLVYASAYLKTYYPAAFYAAMLNNQPMGFYHPATLVKDAQRHGVRFASIDVQRSDWLCRVEEDGTVRLGLRYVAGLREEVGRRIESALSPQSSVLVTTASGPDRCPKCGNDDPSLLEVVRTGSTRRAFCNTCAHDWEDETGAARFRTIEQLIAHTGIRRDELATLAAIGALNAFGYDRRGALWQIERAIRPAGELFEEGREAGIGVRDSGFGIRSERPERRPGATNDPERTPNPEPPIPTASVPSERIPNPQSPIPTASGPQSRIPTTSGSPLAPMTPIERVVADYEGTGLTIGPHPMAMRRADLALRGVLRAVDLPHGRDGRRVRVAGAVITRQRPGTAKGFVFLTLEDETGIANIIVRPDLFSAQRAIVVGEPFVLVEGILQIQNGVTAVKADRMHALPGDGPSVESHDFY